VVHGRDGQRLGKVADLDPTIRLATTEIEFAELRPYYDVIFIGSPPFLHLRHLQFAAELGSPVICEKPLIAQRDELPALLKLIDRARLPMAVAHHVRHQPAVRDVVELLRTNRFGRPLAVDLQWCFMMNHQAPNAYWKLDPRLGGSSAMFDCGIHAIDLSVIFFGPPQRVSGTAFHVRSSDTGDCVATLLDYGEFPVQITASQSGDPNGNDLRMTFGNSFLQIEKLFSEKSARKLEIIGGAETRTIRYEPIDLYRLEVEDFCRSLEGSAGVATVPEDELMSTKVLFAIEDAVQSGKVTEL
jgi:predicted dehydrogenase